MRIGELRKLISVQAETQVSDGAGGYDLGWATIDTVWANIKPVSGNKLFTAAHLEGHVTHQITMRYDPGLIITTDMRLRISNRVFNIHAVLNTGERNQWLELLAEEGAAL